ncbi:MAG: metal-dependent transcriptional regulator [Bacteroidetes bacterium]|nr:metal-dependent transcriptional regulator [Bacteroidota bacterium]
MISFTEENYLKAIYKLLNETNGEAVSTNAIAGAMNCKAASVTDMIKKLSVRKYINYEKYQGVTLTDLGQKTALNIVRKHRLWEAFLVTKLNFKWDEVHEIAEQLEHIDSKLLIERLDAFLGYPKFDPHGDPIPDENGKFPESKAVLLSKKYAGDKCVFTGVADHSTLFLNYVDNIGIRIGDPFTIKSIQPFDKTLKLILKNKKQVDVSSRAASNLWVVDNK